MAKRHVSASPSKVDNLVMKTKKEPSLSDIFNKILKLEEGQSTIIESQKAIQQRMELIENDVALIKDDIELAKNKQTETEVNVAELEHKVHWASTKIRELEFEQQRQEQYSRKSSFRILGVEETRDEDAEQLTVDVIKNEISVDLRKEDLDIVHRVGRQRSDKKPRPILVKCLSHKTKSLVMRQKKSATNIKIVEDLAYGIRQVFNDIIQNKDRLNVESVWTIDGKIKYKFCGEERTNMVNSHSDYVRLFDRLESR